MPTASALRSAIDEDADVAMYRPWFAYVAMWLLSAALVIIGAFLSVSGVGVALLCTGLVIAAAALVLEVCGLAPSAPTPEPVDEATLAGIRANLVD